MPGHDRTRLRVVLNACEVLGVRFVTDSTGPCFTRKFVCSRNVLRRNANCVPNNCCNSCFPPAEFVLLGVSSATIALFSWRPFLLLLQVHLVRTNFAVYDEYLSTAIIVQVRFFFVFCHCWPMSSPQQHQELCTVAGHAERLSTLSVRVLPSIAGKDDEHLCMWAIAAERLLMRRVQCSSQSPRLCARYSAD